MRGEKADLILFQSSETRPKSKPDADPGQVEQHLFRLNEIAALKQVVDDRIASHILS